MRKSIKNALLVRAFFMQLFKQLPLLVVFLQIEKASGKFYEQYHPHKLVGAYTKASLSFFVP